MQLRHVALALLVVAVWGTNFVVIKIGLRDFPPFLFATGRFLLSALPWFLFIRRPDVPWRWLALFGLFLGAGQFGLLYLAMRADISPGLASLVIQTQVFFTIALSVAIFEEPVSAVALGGMALAAAGLVVIGWHVDATVTIKGLILTVMAGFFWACANTCVKHVSAHRKVPIDVLGFMVWSSLFAVPPLLALSLLFDGPAAAIRSVATARIGAWVALFWQMAGNTLFGYAAWNWLLGRYRAAMVTPYALLVPVIGMAAAALLLGEPLTLWKLLAAGLVIAGLSVIAVPPLLARRRA